MIASWEEKDRFMWVYNIINKPSTMIKKYIESKAILKGEVGGWKTSGD